MKISNDQVKQVLDRYVRQIEERKSERAKSSDEKAQALTSKPDSVNITARGAEVDKAKEAYGQLPEVRKELVEDLKNKIESGEYDVTSKEVADKIVHRMVVDKLV